MTGWLAVNSQDGTSSCLILTQRLAQWYGNDNVNGKGHGEDKGNGDVDGNH